jgi:hypothetical protein
MLKKALLMSLTVVVAVTLSGVWIASGQEEEVKVPAIPGITVEDPKPSGCVDCHRKVNEERDYRLTSYIKELVEKEEHPDVVAAVNTIPDDCLMCHSKTAAKGIGTEPFATLLHKVHLVGGEENHFITIYQGECTLCHALNPQTGEWRIKSGKAYK